MPRSAEKIGLVTSPRTVRAGAGLRTAAACCAALVFIAACATVPQRTPSEWAGVLPPGATLYASLAVKDSAAFIKRILKETGPGAQDIATLIERTDRMVASVTIAHGEQPRFSVVALGSYPSGFIGMRLSGSKEWARKSGDTGSYWEWGKAGLQMSIPNDAIMLAANGDMQSLLARWSSPRPMPVPADVAADMLKMAFVLYMPELPGGMTENAAKNGVHLPIQDVWMSAVKAPGAYVISGTANTSSEKEAKLLTLVIRLGVVAWMRTENIPNASERLKAITVSPVGNQVRLTGMRVGEDELITLFLAMLKGMSPPEEPAADAPGTGGHPVSQVKTVVLDYGAGNLKSVENALAHLGARYLVTSRPADLEDAQALIFPGVGEAAQSMGELRRTGLDAALREFLASGRKILGICIGCQVIFESSEERATQCLGLFPGQVRRFPPGSGLKVPHMGWNTVHFTRTHPVFDGIPQDSSFYFVHSYYPAPADPAMVAGVTEYGAPFASCIARENLIAFQFHLEKSGPLGLKLLSNFLAWDVSRAGAAGSAASVGRSARAGASHA